MGFLDTILSDEGAGYVTGDEKDDIIANGTPFVITGVKFDAGGGFEKGTDRFVLDVTLNGEARRMSFQTGTVDSRDRNLAKIAEYLAAGNTLEDEPVTLEKSGRSTLIVKA